MDDLIPEELQSALGPVLGGLVGDKIRPILRGVNVGVGYMIRVVVLAYEEDPETAAEIVKSDKSGLRKLADLNDLLLDGDDDG